MKKKIAVFANGWSTEFLKLVLEGVKAKAFELNIDIYMYLSYATDIRGEAYSIGEGSIFKFPDLKDFDGIILLPSTFNSVNAIYDLEKRLKECNTPAISIEYPIEGIDYIGTGNYDASYELAEHLIKEHNVKKALFMGGVADNKDTVERLKGVSDAFKNAGMDIPADGVLYGYFAYQVARNVTKEWIEGHDYLPDAIICANDEMALGVCVELIERNINVPGDVIVTGYDSLEVGQRFKPSITSVHRSWKDIGAKAIEHLLDKMEGKTTESYVLLESKPVFRESCGCVSEDIDVIRYRTKNYLFEEYTHSRENVLADEMVSTFCTEVVENADINAISSIVNKTMKFYNYLYGKILRVYVNEMYTKLDTEYIGYDYFSDEIYCMCDVNDGEVRTPYKVTKQRIISDLDAVPGNHFYVFLPIHNRDNIIGFCLFDNCLEHVYDYSFNSANRHITAAIEKIRQSAILINANKKLKSLSEHDNLTGVYNRMAYDNYAVSLIKKLKEKGKKSVALIVDIDKMKGINDKFGHLQGDVAIKLVARVLKEFVEEDWLVIRYGGDEFFIVGESRSKLDVNLLSENINQKLDEYVEKRNIPFSVSVSVGGVEIEPDDENEIDHYFLRADECMYNMKSIHHKYMTEMIKMECMTERWKKNGL